MIVTRADGGGVDLASLAPVENIQRIRVQQENGAVTIWVTLGPKYQSRIDELVQYLSPSEAMALAKGLERCAIAALREGS